MKKFFNLGTVALLLGAVVLTVLVAQSPQTLLQHAAVRVEESCPSGYVYSLLYNNNKCVPDSQAQSDPCIVQGRGDQDYCGRSLIQEGATHANPNDIYDCSEGAVFSTPKYCSYGCYISSNAGDGCNAHPAQSAPTLNDCSSGNKSYNECEKGNSDFCTEVAGLRRGQVGHVAYNGCTHQWSCKYAGTCNP